MWSNEYAIFHTRFEFHQNHIAVTRIIFSSNKNTSWHHSDRLHPAYPLHRRRQIIEIHWNLIPVLPPSPVCSAFLKSLDFYWDLFDLEGFGHNMEEGRLCQWSVIRSVLAILQWWSFNVTVIIINKWIFQVWFLIFWYRNWREIHSWLFKFWSGLLDLILFWVMASFELVDLCCFFNFFYA